MSCMLRLTASAVVLAAVVVFPAAMADTPAGQSAMRTIQVSYADLDLSREAGARTLLGRMKAATIKVCGKRPAPRDISANVRHAACSHDAMSRAIVSVDSPTLAALFDRNAGARQVAAR